MISVLVLTLNEEKALPACLDSVNWCDDVVVFDSFSTDATMAIAQARGARVIRRRFDGYASQRNAALQIRFKEPWVLMLDADERVTGELREEMQLVVRNAPEHTT
ncbi:MAG: glycosyltransferase family 2 protein, partial [Limisphaerales bacterium]